MRQLWQYLLVTNKSENNNNKSGNKRQNHKWKTERQREREKHRQVCVGAVSTHHAMFR